MHFDVNLYLILSTEHFDNDGDIVLAFQKLKLHPNIKLCIYISFYYTFTHISHINCIVLFKF